MPSTSLLATLIEFMYMVLKLSAVQTAQNPDCFPYPSQVQWDILYPAETDPNTVFSVPYIVLQQSLITTLFLLPSAIFYLSVFSHTPR